MKCSSCGVENPDEVKHCLKCGASLDTDRKTSAQPKPVNQFVAAQAQSSVSKMLETPGTTLLTLGVVILLVCIVVGAFGHWVAGLALFAVSIVLIYFAVQLRGHESRRRQREPPRPRSGSARSSR